MNTALRAASLTLRSLLRDQLEADLNLRDFFDPARGGTMVVTLLTPEEMDESGQEGLSLWLYRIERDEQTLNAPPQRVAVDRLRRPPLPLRLHYLATPIVDNIEHANGPELEQTILGVVLQCLYDHPLLRGALLQDDLAGSATELHVRLEPMDLEEITRVWDALDRSYQLSASYEVGVVPVASALEPSEGPPVRVVATEHGVIVGAPETP
jgi:hypothetical protein